MPALWSPQNPQIMKSQMAQFWEKMRKTYPQAKIEPVASAQENAKGYSSLHHWSVTHIEDFWSQWLDQSGIHYAGAKTPVLSSNRMPDAQFFPHMTLNYAENLLRTNSDKTALISLSESRPQTQLSFKELRSEVARIASFLKKSGIVKGDRIAGVMPNCEEAVIAMLATVSMGAIWSSCSPDFGTSGILDRLSQIEPKIIVMPTAYRYGGKDFLMHEKISSVIEKLPSIQTLITFEFAPCSEKFLVKGKIQHVRWNEIPQTNTPLTFEHVPFNHPLFIMYSSGTTGLPKCIVHGHGGTLLQHTKEHMLHCDLIEESKLFYFTTCGWMMWNWLVSGLFTGATIVLYDGSPAFPSIEVLWNFVDQHDVTHFGTSARFIGNCRGKISPKKQFAFSKLQSVLSTGSPLLPEDFDWIYSDVKSDLLLASISGGTDIISCFILGNPCLSVHRGEIQCFGLGMDVAAFDDDGKALTKEKAELVCRAPFASMPVAFWNDPDRTKYKKAYFHRIPHVWFHGDYIEITETQSSAGGIIVYGRSDATLNPGGVRIGTAEIYRIVETIQDIEDSIVIGQPFEGDVRVVLFIKLKTGIALTEELTGHIKKTIRQHATPRHVPQIILEVNKIPYTLSGKKTELAVLEIITGREPKNKDALADPTALDAFRNKL